MPRQWRTKGRYTRKGYTMADLIAIGYPDEATAEAAADDEKELQDALHGGETVAQ
jgi:hypothetical protein